ncbi:MAG: hypothetical protein AAF467_11445 [Actinomycetota bacterium]
MRDVGKLVFVVWLLVLASCGPDSGGPSSQPADDAEETATEEVEAVEETESDGVESSATEAQASEDPTAENSGLDGEPTPLSSCDAVTRPNPNRPGRSSMDRMIDELETLAGGDPPAWSYDVDQIMREVIDQELSVEGSVRLVMMEVTGIDPLITGQDDADLEFFQFWVDRANDRIREMCNDGVAVRPAVERAIGEVAEDLLLARANAVVDNECPTIEAELMAANAAADPTDLAGAQNAVADRYDELLAPLQDFGLPAGSPVGAFIDELSDDPAAQREAAAGLQALTDASAAGDLAAYEEAAQLFLAAAEATVVEAQEAEAAAAEAALDQCEAVYGQNAIEGQQGLDAARAQLTGG